MSKSKEYQERAKQCFLLARGARDQTNKTLLLEMAQTWLALSEKALNDQNGAIIGGHEQANG